MRRGLSMVLVLALAGCVRGYYHDMTTGLRGDHPQVAQQFNYAKTVCDGERAKILATSTAGTIATIDAGERVMDACMIQYGFEVRPGGPR
jgi:hypothetical protein